MSVRAENRVVNLAGLVQGITLVTFPAASSVFTDLAGMGIGGQYAVINSAIDEMMPSNYRGRVDIWINGTYWAAWCSPSSTGSAPPRSRSTDSRSRSAT